MNYWVIFHNYCKNLQDYQFCFHLCFFFNISSNDNPCGIFIRLQHLTYIWIPFVVWNNILALRMYSENSTTTKLRAANIVLILWHISKLLKICNHRKFLSNKCHFWEADRNQKAWGLMSVPHSMPSNLWCWCCNVSRKTSIAWQVTTLSP